jgi:hypothetical protein
MVRNKKKLDKQMAALQARLDPVRDEEERSLRHHSNVSRRLICEMIQAKLPRELRDMVYGYLTTFSQVYVKLPANGKGMCVPLH